MKNVLFVLFVAIIAASCENDIDLDAADTSGVLCINGCLTAGTDDNLIHVAVTSKTGFVNVPNAKLEIRVNGNLEQTIEHESVVVRQSIWQSEESGHYQVTAKFNPGDFVQVDAYYNGQHAYSGGVVPQPVTSGKVDVKFAKDVSYKPELWIENYAVNDMSMVAVTIDDPNPSAKNYFRMAVTQSDTIKSRVDENGWHLDTYSWHMDDYTFDEFDEFGGGQSEYYEDGRCNDYQRYSYYFENDPILSAEVVKSQGDISFVDAVDNIYKIFNDNFFNGSSATINVMFPFFDSHFMPDKYYYVPSEYYAYDPPHEISYYAPHYTHRNYVTVYSITEDEYYYLKVLNARGPGSYFEFDEETSLTGDVKLPSNVNGGSGNIFLSSSTTLIGSMFEDYVPEYGGSDVKEEVYW